MTVAEFQSGAWFAKANSEHHYRYTRDGIVRRGDPFDLSGRKPPLQVFEIRESHIICKHFMDGFTKPLYIDLRDFNIITEHDS